MPEYMDYNSDYDFTYKTKGQKIRSNLVLVLSILFIVLVVIFVIVRMPENVRTNFKTVTSLSHKSGEKVDSSKNEFITFYNNYKQDEQITENEEFEKSYPNLFKLMHTSKSNVSKNKVFSFDDNGALTLASIYCINEQVDSDGNKYDANLNYIIGEVGIDFCVFTYDSTNGFTVNKPTKFSIHYYTRKQDTPKRLEICHVDLDSFKLNFYTLGVKIDLKRGFNDINTKMNLSEGINKSQYNNNFFFESVDVKNADNQSIKPTCTLTSGGNRGDKDISYNYKINETLASVTMQITFNDEMYNKFSSYSIENIKGAKYTIVVN